MAAVISYTSGYLVSCFKWDIWVLIYVCKSCIIGIFICCALFPHPGSTDRIVNNSNNNTS